MTCICSHKRHKKHKILFELSPHDSSSFMCFLCLLWLNPEVSD